MTRYKKFLCRLVISLFLTCWAYVVHVACMFVESLRGEIATVLFLAYLLTFFTFMLTYVDIWQRFLVLVFFRFITFIAQ